MLLAGSSTEGTGRLHAAVLALDALHHDTAGSRLPYEALLCLLMGCIRYATH